MCLYRKQTAKRNSTNKGKQMNKLNPTVEITKEAFNALTESQELKPFETIEARSVARENRYLSKAGVVLIEIENFLSNVTQYYIQDINA